MADFVPIPSLSDADQKRFWKRVLIVENIDECWDWCGGKNVAGGYGNFYINGKDFRAHRVSYFISNSVDPGNLYVCHKCDRPSCVNPNHLFIGTARDNVLDMISKGRANRLRGEDHPFKDGNTGSQGEKHGCSKLIESQVIEIIDSFSREEITYNDLSIKYGVSVNVIYRIVSGKSWKHLNICRPHHKMGIKFGSKHHKTVLSEQDVINIRSTYSRQKVSMTELGRRYSVSQSSISDIIHGSSWRRLLNNIT